jgi:predicted transposase/invertase (TIGR01784 family)
MNAIRLNPLNDFLFMRYMGQEEDEEQLQAFLNVVLHETGNEKLVSVKVTETNLSANMAGDDTAATMNIRAVETAGTKVNIEIQLRATGNMDKRGLFYWCCKYEECMRARDYDFDPPRVVTVNIIENERLPIDRIHATFRLREDNSKDCVFGDIPEIHFIDMAKFRCLQEKDLEHNPLHRWLAFFDRNTSDSVLQEIIKTDASIGKAYRKYMSVVQDSEIVRGYEMREMELSNSADEKTGKGMKDI